MNSKKVKWCPNENNQTRTPTKEQVESERKAKIESHKRGENRGSWHCGYDVPFGMKRPRLTCSTCSKRFKAEIVYDHNDDDLIGYRVPKHKVRVTKVTRKKW
jgi:hypothetical protein